MCGLSTLEQTEAARRSGRSRHRSNSSNDLLIRGDILRYRARSFQPKFRPVRPGKVVHVKRWTSFFETFLVGPHRSIEFWTEITGNWGWMVAPIFIVLSQISMFVYGHNVFIISGRWIFEKGLLKLQPLKLSRSILQEIVTIFLRNASSFFGWHTVTRDLVTIEIESTSWSLLPSHAFFTDLPFPIRYFYRSPIEVVFLLIRS